MSITYIKEIDTPRGRNEPYLDRDLSPSGPYCAELLSKIDVAAVTASAGKVYLSELTGKVPRHLTPEMQDWYLYATEGREQELQALNNAFDEDRVDESGATAIFIEGARHQAEDERVKRKLQFIQAHKTNSKADYAELDRLNRQFRESEQRYGEMRIRLGNRDPKVTNKPIYFIGLLLIGVAEALLNYESFAALKWASPAIASGLTFLVAIAVAFASHYHGTLLKQIEFYFGEQNSRTAKWRAGRLFGLGTTALTLALAAVFYARDTYLSDLLTVNRTFGASAETSPFWVIGGSLLGNIIVYVVGCMLAFAIHDSNPEFPERKQELDALKTKTAKLQNWLDKARQEEFGRIKKRYEDRIAEIKNIESSQRSLKSASQSRQRFADLKRQDSRVEAALRDFRTKLISRAGGQVEFVCPTEDGDIRSLTAQQYNAMPIDLKYGHVE